MLSSRRLDEPAEINAVVDTYLHVDVLDVCVDCKFTDRELAGNLGKIVEKASVDDIFYDPRHPYTKGLMASIPSLTTTKDKRLIPIEGVVPDITQVRQGCDFESRCNVRMGTCARSAPPLCEVAPGHFATCWHLVREESA